MKLVKLLSPFLLLAQIAIGQQHYPDSLEWFIKKEATDYNTPGLAIGIIKDNKILLSKGYGIISTTDPVPVTSKTIFPILSCTKAFTAAAIGILVDERKIHWEDKVVKYLPDFKLSDPNITRQLTISDILSHRSGLSSFEGDLLWYGTNYSRKQIVGRLQFSPFSYPYRSEFGYQNILYLVAAMIIEKVTGKTWDAFVRERIFAPLNMRNTYTSLQEIQGLPFAKPHLSNVPVPPVSLDNIAPAGSINSTVDDMLAWLQLWIDHGKYNGIQLLSNETTDSMTSPKIYLSPKHDEGYGFGWQISSGDEKKVISHGGGMPGYKSLITINPQSKTAVIILTNKISYLPEELTGVIFDFLDSVPVNWADRDNNLATKNFRYPWEETINIGKTSASAIPNFISYQGSYEDQQYGKITISKKGDTAVLQFNPVKNQYYGYLSYKSEDTLHIVFSDAFISPGNLIFKRDKHHRVTGFIFNIPPGDFIFDHFRFKKQGVKPR